jgi:hypothetical protein
MQSFDIVVNSAARRRPALFCASTINALIAFCVITNSLFNYCDNTKRNYNNTEVKITATFAPVDLLAAL